jgi:hypothetical protein
MNLPQLMNQPRSGGSAVSPARERRVKWEIELSRGAAAQRHL